MENYIQFYIYCKRCAKEKPNTQSVDQYSRIKVGKTQWGIQVWCARCDTHIVHFDIEQNTPGDSQLLGCECEKCAEEAKEIYSVVNKIK